jgi:molybdopterin-synthase adenylyltransferase
VSEERYNRQILLFGADGQRNLATTRVAIVGLGGLGCHVGQQLAYLGVLGYVLIDHDHVTASSVNRLIGALEVDITAQTKKVTVSERLITTVQPQAGVNSIPERLTSASAREAIASAAVLFACLDDDVARIELIKICTAAGVPFFDLATDTDEAGDQLAYGGRVLFSGEGERCPHCMDLLDQRQLRRAFMSPEQRAADDSIYGVERGALDATGPSVVSINGVVASLAVTEFMVRVTGLRAATPLLTYRGDLGIVTKSLDEPREGCPYCSPRGNRHPSLRENETEGSGP